MYVVLLCIWISIGGFHDLHHLKFEYYETKTDCVDHQFKSDAEGKNPEWWGGAGVYMWGRVYKTDGKHGIINLEGTASRKYWPEYDRPIPYSRTSEQFKTMMTSTIIDTHPHTLSY